ncbi:unnamed protein product [Echinostoma caproni]|uniref:TOX high mobility group box family member 4 n=1 Tax=Echinostoma caproni TaxID=27848 RepID=A0A182ZZN7_9TREM|nr:unnamed protein product [Echinostoma caproni]
MTVVANSTDDESDDADDNIPLSKFVPIKTVQQDPPSPEPVPSPEPEPTVVLCPCTKPAVLDDPRWDGQYCSPECLISVCHRAFEFWLRMHRDGAGISGC